MWVSTGFSPIETGSSLVMLIVWVVVLVALIIPFVRINEKLVFSACFGVVRVLESLTHSEKF